jgi:putative ABC transport system ATP-binding protein
MNDFIRIDNLLKTYRKEGQIIRALEIEELALAQEGIVLVRGKSGAGKTTLLNMIGLLDRPTSGKVMINGEDTSGIDENKKNQLRKEKFGFIFQAFNLIPTLTVQENILLPLLPAKLNMEKIREVDSLLERVGLAERKKHLPAELSQGEQQRVAIVRALINNPQAILADEPTSNLDPENTKIILDLLLGIREERKLLLMVASNDMGFLRDEPHREIRLEEGKLKLTDE